VRTSLVDTRSLSSSSWSHTSSTTAWMREPRFSMTASRAEHWAELLGQ
jgi:hypothetical protein